MTLFRVLMVMENLFYIVIARLGTLWKCIKMLEVMDISVVILLLLL